MAHLNQREAREARRKKGLAFLSVFLLVPLVLAGYFLFNILSQRLTAETVDKILLSAPSKNVSASITEREEIALCMNAIKNAKAITESARPYSEYVEVTLDCTDEYMKETYRFYFSDSANDALLLNAENKVYMLTAEDALALMLSDSFSFLYQTKPFALTMTLDGERITPEAGYKWNYFVADGSVRETSDDAENTVCDVTAALPTFEIDGSPDETKLTVSIGNDVKTGAIANLATFLPTEKAEVDVCITATWSNPEADGYYGTAEYRFIFNYTPAEA